MSAVQPFVVDDGTETRYLATFGARASAFLIDWLLAVASTLPGLIVLILSPTRGQACTVDGTTSTCTVPQGSWLAFAMAVVVVGFALQLVWYSRRVSRRQSVGQQAAGIRVVDQRTVERIGAWRAGTRQFTRLVSTIPFGLGYLWMLWDPERQTWHDKLVGTIVIKA
ncbi:MAG: RDD family protein [Ilumatobacteraceae bacterium]